MKTLLVNRLMFSDGVAAHAVAVVKVWPSREPGERPHPFFLVRSGGDAAAFSSYREAASEFRREGFFLRSLGFRPVSS